MRRPCLLPSTPCGFFPASNLPGALHVGNYFGMMQPAIELQNEGEAYYFIADYHSMTSLYDADNGARIRKMWRWIFSRADWIRPRRYSSAKAMCPKSPS